MISENFRLIVITPEKSTSGEIWDIIKLFESGMQILHVRKPGFNMNEMKKLLNAIPFSFHSRIVIHSHYELLNEFRIKGVHLPERIRKEGKTSNIENIISTSFHRMEEVIESKSNFEYVFFSPVFQSISKQEYKPSYELKTLKDLMETNKNAIKFPIIALGGITDKNILQTKSMGFNGAACIGYILGNSNPVAQFSILQKIIES